MFKNATASMHPGTVLREDCLEPLDMSANGLAKALHVPASRIDDVVLERRGITADTALRLTCYFGGEVADAEGWIDLRATHDSKKTSAESAKSFAKKSSLLE